jgi:hypothetical protein
MASVRCQHCAARLLCAGQVGPDAGSAVNTPTLPTIWPGREGPARGGADSARQLGRPSPLSTLKPFSIVKVCDNKFLHQLRLHLGQRLVDSDSFQCARPAL